MARGRTAIVPTDDGIILAQAVRGITYSTTANRSTPERTEAPTLSGR